MFETIPDFSQSSNKENIIDSEYLNIENADSKNKDIKSELKNSFDLIIDTSKLESENSISENIQLDASKENSIFEDEDILQEIKEGKDKNNKNEFQEKFNLSDFTSKVAVKFFDDTYAELLSLISETEGIDFHASKEDLEDLIYSVMLILEYYQWNFHPIILVLFNIAKAYGSKTISAFKYRKIKRKGVGLNPNLKQESSSIDLTSDVPKLKKSKIKTSKQ
jgi:hypothetical protein